MIVALDTNVLVRFLVQDDLEQLAQARAEIAAADTLFLSTSMLCELVWVLGRSYRLSKLEIAEALRGLMDAEKTTFDAGAVEAGVAMLEAGCDFADGVIAAEGRVSGAEMFVSFDQSAVSRLNAAGFPARAPAS